MNEPICVGLLDIKGKEQIRRVYAEEGIAPTLTAKGGGNHEVKVCESAHGSRKVRKLTPKEYYRLMGFTDEQYERAAKVISNTQLYKTAGNSIIVDVLAAIFGEMIA